MNLPVSFESKFHLVQENDPNIDSLTNFIQLSQERTYAFIYTTRKLYGICITPKPGKEHRTKAVQIMHAIYQKAISQFPTLILATIHLTKVLNQGTHRFRHEEMYRMGVLD